MSLAEVVFHRLAHCYTINGGGFSTGRAGTVCKAFVEDGPVAEAIKAQKARVDADPDVAQRLESAYVAREEPPTSSKSTKRKSEREDKEEPSKRLKASSSHAGKKTHEK
jgi:hypothetical protein